MIKCVAGCIIFSISFFACCGACSEKSWMVYIYTFLMIVILLAQFGSSIAAFVLKVGIIQFETAQVLTVHFPGRLT